MDTFNLNNYLYNNPLLSEIKIEKPGSFDPKIPSSSKYLISYLKNNYKSILEELSKIHDLEGEAGIADFNNIVVDDYNSIEEDLDNDSELKAQYPGGANVGIYNPDFIDECQGISISNLPNKVMSEIMSGTYFREIPNFKGLYYDIMEC